MLWTIIAWLCAFISGSGFIFLLYWQLLIHAARQLANRDWIIERVENRKDFVAYHVKDNLTQEKREFFLHNNHPDINLITLSSDSELIIRAEIFFNSTLWVRCQMLWCTDLLTFKRKTQPPTGEPS